LGDTKRLKELAEFVIKNGGKTNTQLNKNGSALFRWEMPSNLQVMGDKGALVSAVRSLRRRISAAQMERLDGYRDMMEQVTGQRPSRADVRAMSAERLSVLERSAKVASKTQGMEDNPDLSEIDTVAATQAAFMRREVALRTRRSLIDNNPNSLQAQDFQQREERKRLAAARKDPTSPEFVKAEHEKLDKASAADKAQISWAKKHRSDPRAKAILKNRTLSGRAKAMMQRAGRTITHTVLTAIAAAMGAAVKFLSALPGVASDIHHLAAKGNALAMNTETLRKYEHIEKITGMKEGAIAESLGAIVYSLPDLASGQSQVNRMLGIAAPVAVRDPRSTLISKITDYAVNQGDPSVLWREAMNTAGRLAVSGTGALGNEAEFAEAMRTATTVLERVVPGIQREAADLVTALYSGGITENQRQMVNRVANGESLEINGVKVASGDWFGAIEALLDGPGSTYKPRDTASQIERKAAEETAQTWRSLLTTASEIRDAILIKLLGSTEGIAAWLRNVLKQILLLVGGDKAIPVVEAMDEVDYVATKEAMASLSPQIAGMERIVEAAGSSVGITTKAAQDEAFAKWQRGEGVPVDQQMAGKSEAYRAFIEQLYVLKQLQEKYNTFENAVYMYENRATSGYETGDFFAPTDYSPSKTAMIASNKASNAYAPFAARVQEKLSEYREPVDESKYFQLIDEYNAASEHYTETMRFWYKAKENGNVLLIAQAKLESDMALERRQDAEKKMRDERARLEDRGRSRETVDAFDRFDLAEKNYKDALEGKKVWKTEADGEMHVVLLDTLEKELEDARSELNQVINVQKTVESYLPKKPEDFESQVRLQTGGNVWQTQPMVWVPAPVAQPEVERIRNGVSARDAEDYNAVVLQLLEAIEAQHGRAALDAVINGEFTINGNITAEERVWSIEFLDKKTSERIRVEGIPLNTTKNVEIQSLQSQFTAPSRTVNPRAGH
jgi:hypothetical protein